MKVVLSFLVLLLSLWACEKDADIVVMSYSMTQCADPWHDEAFFNGDKEKALSNFLNKQGIEVKTITIVQDEDCAKLIQCAACQCQSCLVATVEVAEDDVAAMEKLKFKKK
jgi:hypothetical protein